jgi:rhamnosyltransferase
METFRPKVLVLLASYNGAKWIGAQLDTILAQEGVDVRIIIRDDRSSDTTIEEVGRFAAETRINLLTSDKPSGSASRNFFALIHEHSSKEYDFVALADQDDLWHQDKLARACRALQISGAAGYSSATIARWPTGKERLVNLSGPPNANDFLFEGAGQGCTFVLSAKFFERFRQFISQHWNLIQELHFHDWAIYAIARTWALQWYFDPTPSLIYQQHESNDTGARGSLLGLRTRLALIRKGWYRDQLEKICLLSSAADPSAPRTSIWRAILHEHPSWRRTARLVRFSLHAGRRRTRDQALLILACIAGWI